MKGLLKRTGILLLAALMAGMVYSCESQDDPAAAWLLALAEPTADETTDGTKDDVPENITGDFDLTVDPYKGSEDFLFDTTKEIVVNITVVNGFNVADGAKVRVYKQGDTSQIVYFTAIVDEKGNVSGDFTINTTTNVVTLEVTYNGETYIRDFEIKYISVISGRIVFDVEMREHVPTVVDTDMDGIPDDEDAYPEDPDRATVVRYPEATSGDYFTIAYEDLYPKPGDMDFNDYVVRATYEEDLNAHGEIVGIRARFVHVAKGAGYKHTFHLKVPGAPNMNYHLVRTKADGTVVLDESGVVAAGEDLEVLPKSNTTLASSNTSNMADDNFKLGWSADVDLVFVKPVNKKVVGSVPYDPYIKVLNTNQEVHFPGLYEDPDAGWFDEGAEADLYIDNNGFPWALMIPGDWFWPYERGDIHEAYTSFDDWYTSFGDSNTDWYLTPDMAKVFSY
jgi:LruC domain-containing protein